jgi:hypothetical protein
MKLRVDGDVVVFEYDQEGRKLMMVLDNVTELNDGLVLAMDVPQPLERVELAVEPKAMHEAASDGRGSGG